MIRFYDDPDSARGALFELAHRLDEASDGEIDALCLDIGCGDLETLLRRWEEDLWADVEQLARTNRRFRRALQSVWAYSSPKYEDRDALLWELGEWQRFELRAVVYRRKLSDSDRRLAWRAIEPPSDIEFAELAHVLRSMADWADRVADRPADQGPRPAWCRATGTHRSRTDRTSGRRSSRNGRSSPRRETVRRRSRRQGSTSTGP